MLGPGNRTEPKGTGMPKKECAFCQKEYEGRPQRKFCSRKCYELSKRKINYRGGSGRVCEKCGKPICFQAKSLCLDCYKKKQYDEKPFLICNYCKKKFRSARSGNIQPYCSRKCKDLAATKPEHKKRKNLRKYITHNGKTVLYARYVWEETTGQKIPKGWQVHHLDGDPTNDKFENLEIMKRGEHWIVSALQRFNGISDGCRIAMDLLIDNKPTIANDVSIKLPFAINIKEPRKPRKT